MSNSDLQDRYRKGENIAGLLRGNRIGNSCAAIELAYDLQAGTYVENLKDDLKSRHLAKYTDELASRLRMLGGIESMLEVGVGEATTLASLLSTFSVNKAFGFDLSWSRINVAKHWLAAQIPESAVELCTANLFQIPFPNDSIDIVYTSHSIEPNGGRELDAIKEICRVARKWIVLLEPAFEFASDEARERMKFHGYCTKLAEAIQTLELNVICYEPFPFSANPLNPTGITIIEKSPDSDMESRQPKFVCPVTKGNLKPIDNVLYSPNHLSAYPILGSIPCLREENAILCSNIEAKIKAGS